MIKEMATVLIIIKLVNSGALVMKVRGKMIKKMEKESKSIQQVKFTMAIGRII